MKRNMRTAALSVLIAAVLLAGTASAAFAAQPLAVHIEVNEIIATSGEPFAASGPAVDAGLVCPTGTVEDLSSMVSGPPAGAFSILNVVKRFDCDDGSGSFDVRLAVRLDNATGETTARWVVVAGTDDYSNLQANGSLVGTPIVLGYSIHDVYDGMVH
jgi:hypothetical protein